MPRNELKTPSFDTKATKACASTARCDTFYLAPFQCFIGPGYRTHTSDSLDRQDITTHGIESISSHPYNMSTLQSSTLKESDTIAVEQELIDFDECRRRFEKLLPVLVQYADEKVDIQRRRRFSMYGVYQFLTL